MVIIACKRTITQPCDVQKDRQDQGMFVACRRSEARYLIRTLGGKPKLGLAKQSVLTALGNAIYLTPPRKEHPPEITDAGKGMKAETLKQRLEEYSLIIKTTYCECHSYDSVIPNLLEHGSEELPKRCKLTQASDKKYTKYKNAVPTVRNPGSIVVFFVISGTLMSELNSLWFV